MNRCTLGALAILMICPLLRAQNTNDPAGDGLASGANPAYQKFAPDYEVEEMRGFQCEPMEGHLLDRVSSLDIFDFGKAPVQLLLRHSPDHLSKIAVKRTHLNTKESLQFLKGFRAALLRTGQTYPVRYEKIAAGVIIINSEAAPFGIFPFTLCRATDSGAAFFIVTTDPSSGTAVFVYDVELRTIMSPMLAEKIGEN